MHSDCDRSSWVAVAEQCGKLFGPAMHFTDRLCGVCTESPNDSDDSKRGEAQMWNSAKFFLSFSPSLSLSHFRFSSHSFFISSAFRFPFFHSLPLLLYHLLESRIPMALHASQSCQSEEEDGKTDFVFSIQFRSEPKKDFTIRNDLCEREEPTADLR